MRTVKTGSIIHVEVLKGTEIMLQRKNKPTYFTYVWTILATHMSKEFLKCCWLVKCWSKLGVKEYVSSSGLLTHLLLGFG